MKAHQAPRGGRKRLGNALMISGALLLLAFFAFRGWSAGQGAAGIRAFEEARAATLPAVMAAESAAGMNLAARANPWGGTPDTTLWSPKRIEDYNTALEANGDAPHAVLNIEHLNIRVPVYNGADDFNLNRGVARIIGTGRIGETGNLGIAGHRDGFFRPLKDIQLGDRLELQTYFGTEVYEVSSIDIIDPSELHVLAPTDTPTVTLVTCYPFYHVGHAPQRFIVKAEALEDQVSS